MEIENYKLCLLSTTETYCVSSASVDINSVLILMPNFYYTLYIKPSDKVHLRCVASNKKQMPIDSSSCFIFVVTELRSISATPSLPPSSDIVVSVYDRTTNIMLFLKLLQMHFLFSPSFWLYVCVLYTRSNFRFHIWIQEWSTCPYQNSGLAPSPGNTLKSTGK